MISAAAVLRRMKEKTGSFALLQLVFYASHGSYGLYRVVFLSERGVSGSMIGLILTVSACMPIFAQPLWGVLCDRIGSIRKVFIPCLTICMTLVPLLTLMRSEWAYLVLMTVISVFMCPFFAFMDAWTIQGIKQMAGNPSFGSLRMWGSIGFVPVMLVYGLISRSFSTDTLFWIYAAMNVLTVTVAACIPFGGVPASAPPADSTEKAKKLNPVILFKNYKFISFILCFCFVNTAVVAMFSYLPQRVAFAGGSTWTYSLLISFGALCELPMYGLSSWLIRKFKPEHIIAAAMTLTSAHLMFLSFGIPVWALLVVHILRGAAFGLFAIGNVYYSDSVAPDGLKTSAQSISGTFGGAVAGVLGSAFGGAVLEASGILMVHQVGAVLSVFASAIFVLTLSYGRIRVRMQKNAG